MYSVERAVELLEDDAITGTDIKTGLREPLMSTEEAKTSDKTMRGVGVIEAPRGTLFHDYETDGAGIIQEGKSNSCNWSEQPLHGYRCKRNSKSNDKRR